jgi:hypothetical protein
MSHSYLKVTEFDLVHVPRLFYLMWGEECTYNYYDVHASWFAVPEDHPNIPFIVTCLDNPQWIDLKLDYHPTNIRSLI